MITNQNPVDKQWIFVKRIFIFFEKKRNQNLIINKKLNIVLYLFLIQKILYFEIAKE